MSEYFSPVTPIDCAPQVCCCSLWRRCVPPGGACAARRQRSTGSPTLPRARRWPPLERARRSRRSPPLPGRMERPASTASCGERCKLPAGALALHEWTVPLGGGRVTWNVSVLLWWKVCFVLWGTCWLNVNVNYHQHKQYQQSISAYVKEDHKTPLSHNRHTQPSAENPMVSSGSRR